MSEKASVTAAEWSTGREGRQGSAAVEILVYSGLELMGDGVMKLPFVAALRERWPDARITWLAGKGRTVFAHELKPLVAGLIDEVIEDAGIGSHGAELLRRPPLARFDLTIDTQRRLLTTLILRRIRTRCFVSGTADFWLSAKKPPRGYMRPKAMLRQMLDLIEVAGGRPARPGYNLRLDAEWVTAAATALADGPDYIGFAPGAGGVHKRWPLDRFIALARREAERGRVPVFLLGPAEADWSGELCEAVPGARFPLQDPTVPPEIAGSPLFTIAVARRLAVAVANDSGTGHLIAAAGRPMVSLFGPTPPAKFAPAAPVLEIVRAQDFGGEAMAAIPLDGVASALDRILDGRGR
jgi:ADP-heptose:LPS heptosyltransferase